MTSKAKHLRQAEKALKQWCDRQALRNFMKLARLPYLPSVRVERSPTLQAT